MLRDLFSLFPAYAGVIPTQQHRKNTIFPFPRIRGGDPHYEYSPSYNDFFSPHTRG